MAYISTEKTSLIRKHIKEHFPVKEGWKISLRKEHSSSLECVIKQAPLSFDDLLEGRKYLDVNNYWLRDCKPEHKEPLMKLLSILDGEFLEKSERNFDNSNSQIDYFHVGWYVHLSIGKWCEEFNYIPKN